MALMGACGVLLAVAVVLTVRWRGYASVVPAWAEPVGASSAGGRLRELAGRLCVGLLSGLLTGALVVGPGGRLAMRLLAATSPDARGRVTDAGEVVGEITVSGTIGLFIFVGVPGGLAVGLIYALAADVVPRGALGGALLGFVLLVVLGSRVDPLRPDNPDFVILESGWLAVVTFTLLAVSAGAFAAASAGWLAATLPAPRPWWAFWLAPIGLLALPALAVVWWALLLVLVGSLAYIICGAVPALRRPSARYGHRALQLLVVGISLLALPGFVGAVGDIVM